MTGKPSDRALDRAFDILERAAVNGERCPCARGPNKISGITNKAIITLARTGRIFIEVSAHNWRRVTILTGPHKGKSTAPNPLKSARAHLTVGTDGTHYKSLLR